MQAALTGDSAAFDARGRLLAWAGSGYRGIILVRLSLPPASARTPYDRLGDYVPWTAIAIIALAAVLGLFADGPTTSGDSSASPGPAYRWDRNLGHGRRSVAITERVRRAARRTGGQHGTAPPKL